MNPINSLSVNSSKSLPQNSELFTTKQIAEQLTVDSKTIRTNAKKCLKNKVFENGKITYFTKEEVTILIDYMQKHKGNNRPDLYLEGTGTVVSTSTELTPALKIKQAMALMQEGYEEELAILKAKNIEMQPKADVYDQLVDRSKTINFRDFASKIGFSQNEFMTILKSKYIYKNSIGEYRAYSEYQKYFSLRTFPKGVDKTGEQLMLNMDGITYFTNKYKPNAVAESFIKKSESEYKKIIDNTANNYIERAIEHCPECNNTYIDKIKTYTFKQVADASGENEQTIINFCKAKGWIDDNNKPLLVKDNHLFFKGLLTQAGRDHIVATYLSIKDAEKGMRKSEFGKAE